MELLDVIKLIINFSGLETSLHKFHPHSEKDALKWDFISRSLYSDTNMNPRRRIETPLREGLDDVVREVLDLSTF